MAVGTQQVGNAAQQAAPHVSTVEKTLKDLTRSAEETSRGVLQMALAARGGIGAFPQLALGLREATQGFKGVNEGMALLAPTARLAVIGLGAVAIGITAIGAAVAAYGISVFKFSQEMFTLSQTARSLGMTFGQLRNMTEQNERFGISAENTVAQLGQMNEALTDLTLSGSKLRQQLLNEGVPPQWIDDYLKLTNQVDRYNKVREAEIQVHDDWKRRTGSEEIASTLAGRIGKRFGVDPTAWTRPAMEQPTAEELAQSKRIEDSSKQIAEQWRIISKHVTDIKTEFLAWGLPGVLETLKLINTGFEGILATVKAIATAGLKQIPILGQLIQIKEIYDRVTGGGKAATEGGNAPKPGEPTPESTLHPPEAPAPETGGGISGWYRRRYQERENALKQPTSFRGANDNVNPLLHRTSFGGPEGYGGGGGEGRAQAIIKGGVYEALIEFYGFLQSGAKGGAGGGVQQASFGGAAGAAAGGGAAGADIASTFGGGGYKNLGGGSVIPSDQAIDAKDKAWLGGGRVGGGGGGAPHGSHVGAGAGEGAGETPAGGAGGGDPSKTGNAFLASQRARLKKELDDNPELKRRFAAIIQTENVGAGKQVAESAMNRAIMTGRSMASILGGGAKSFYGPVRRGMIEPTMRSMSAKTLAERYAQIDAGLAGGNTVRGATDQGSRGDPNFEAGGQAVPDVNRERFGYWGGFHGVAASRRWAEAQQQQVNRSALEAQAAAAAKSTADTEKSRAAAITVRPVGEGGGYPASLLSMRESQRAPLGLDRGELDRPALDRSAVDKQNGASINSTGKLSVDVNAPPGTKVDYSGDNLLRATSMQRQTQMMPTDTGPTVGDSARSYMRGGS